MKIIVIGGTGFIGRALVGELALQGHEVVVFTRRAGHQSSRGSGTWNGMRALPDPGGPRSRPRMPW